MADKKITQLTNITGADLVDADEFVVVDISADETKAITLGELKEAFDSGSGFVRITGDTMTGDLALSGADVTFGDNDKAIFGAGSDLQIYHSGSNSVITDVGQGSLYVGGDNNVIIASGDLGTTKARFTATDVELYYADAQKLATTSTGIDVTGTVTADGLTVDGDIDFVGTHYVGRGSDLNGLVFNASFGNALTSTADIEIAIDANNADSDREFRVARNNSAFSTTENMMKIAENGDISFYEDTGTTPKFFWDASTERLGIGNAAPTTALDVTGTVTADGLTVDGSATINTSSTSLANFNYIGANKGSITTDGINLKHNATANMYFNVNSANRMLIEGNGDISFYEDTGTTPALTWDASAQSLNVDGPITADGLTVADGMVHEGDTDTFIKFLNNRIYSDVGGNRLLDLQSGVSELNSTGAVEFNTGASLLKRMDVSNNGDISFYEDTGTTPKFFWDASAESLVIGTTSTAGIGEALYLNGGGLFVTGDLTSTNADGFTLGYDGTNAKLAVNGTSGASRGMTFGTVSGGVEGTRMTIDSSGNVGIGTSSPAVQLNVASSGNADIAVQSGNASTASILFGDTVDISRGRIKYDNTSEAMSFEVNNLSEAMRIDSSGNLLVGKTSVEYTSEGLALRERGEAYITSDGRAPLLINRLTSDGDIVSFRKDGSTVGSIGASSGGLYIGNASGFRFDDGSNRVLPYNAETPSTTDGTLNLGAGSARFKDLYLSGGVYLGGIGSANKLDDYEEGAFTPTVSSGVTSPTYSSQSGSYTKIGNYVYFQIRMDLASGTPASSQFQITNLPFTSKNVANYGGAFFSYSAGFIQDLGQVTLHIGPSTSTVYFYKSLDGAVMTGVEVGNAGNILNSFYINGVYLAA